MSFQRTAAPESPSGGRDFFRNLRRGALAALCTLALSACGPVAGLLADNAHDKNPDKATEQKSGSNADSAAPPPEAGIKPLNPGESGNPTTPNGLPALQPRGVRVESLFADKIKDPDERFERVENAVIELRKDFDAVMPSIVRLVAVEDDMQALMEQLEILLSQEPPPAEEPADAMAAQVQLPPAAAPPVQSAPLKPPEPVAAAPPPASPAPSPPVVPAAPPPVAAAAVSPSGAAVKGVRVGEHADKTRLVLDVSAAAPYRYDIDNIENLLIIELPSAAWSAAKNWTSGKAPLLASWTVQPTDDGKGSRLIIQTKKPVSVVYEKAIPASGGEPHRIVLDLKGGP